MTPQEITIMIHSDIDPSQLLDIAIEYGERIAEEVESYGETAVFHEEEVSVTPQEESSPTGSVKDVDLWDSNIV
tara:strand:+ start:363 stop:584 length:222 start_codon:yes stop_codon:yes gene_type:complete